jgi:2-keto-myo-inositol isomerase
MAIDRTRFCLNRIIYPGLDLKKFFLLTRDVGLSYVELRNDLPGGKILDDIPPEKVKKLADDYGIRILTINAVQKFNLGSVLEKVYADVKEMLETAAAIGCYGIVLCPNNDTNDTRTPEQFYQDTVAALKKITPLFKESGITGLVEALGFEECSLRSKKVAIQAIQESGYDGYRIVHDTFHHYLGPDEIVFPEYTGLVHISGVETDIPTPQIRDGHRILIGHRDIMDNKAQIRTLESQGYTGIYSFEPFSSDVQNMPLERLKAALSESLEFMTT